MKAVKMDIKTQEFVRQNIKKYYQKRGVDAPPEFKKREFGFGNEKKIDYRHVTFKNEEDLRSHFISHVPLYASFSAAYYDFPDARPMGKKGFQGADLIFEFDAECNHATIACEACLEKMKQESIKLVEDFLVPDFGFDKKDITLAFSGARGYHIYVRNDAVNPLSANARREITDYLQAKDLDVKRIIRAGATLKSKGWKGRLARAAHEHVKQSNEKKFENKDEVLEMISEGNYDIFKGAVSFWKKLLDKEVVHLSTNIDQMLTMDPSRLIRIPSTIHGGSSLLCKYVLNLDEFNPFNDAVVFYNPPIKVKPSVRVPEFVLKEQTFGPLEKDKNVDVPEYVAMYLSCKGLAQITE